ncbi:MAG TPA: hypothetical protein VMO81_04520 [Aestuariivirgaceae bacterium]|nr:hypothetical protein [Aestuariivirgaceae bacterium]
MKSVLHIVAAVLIAAGLVVAVASLLTPGQVILGIDFKLAATLVIGGLILLALANALALLERMSNDLRQLRKAGSEAPPWLRQAAGQSGIQAAAALALAEGAAPAEVARQGPDSEPAQEVGQDIGQDIGRDIGEDIGQPATVEAEWPQATETEWPEASEVQWPEALEPQSREVETPQPTREDETELPFLDALAPAPQSEHDQEPGFEPEPEAKPEEQVADASGVEGEPELTEAEEYAEVPDEPEPAEVATEDYPEEPSEPQFAEPHEAAVWDDAEMPRRLKPSQYTQWSLEEPAEPAEEPEEQALLSEADEDGAQAPEEQPPEEQPSEEPSALYVVEERMFRGKQARVLSDGTVEAETAEGWMRFEDFDHLEEYLDAMAELGR